MVTSFPVNDMHYQLPRHQYMQIQMIFASFPSNDMNYQLSEYQLSSLDKHEHWAWWFLLSLILLHFYLTHETVLVDVLVIMKGGPIIALYMVTVYKSFNTDTIFSYCTVQMLYLANTATLRDVIIFMILTWWTFVTNLKMLKYYWNRWLNSTD